MEGRNNRVAESNELQEGSRAWWKEAVVYQIYPRSFMDSNGDGIGDLPGIASKLDYLQDLGVDVLWLCPVYDSPNADNGYDIRDYHRMMKEFGTLEQFDELLREVHRRGMKLIMDLVVNHTSDQHPWFIRSRSSATNPYRNWYIWRPGKNGREPNNWRSHFGGSAWSYDEMTGEYYLHLFSPHQPDLNWDNPEVRKAIYQMMTWWLDKGIDGFRMDVINCLSKVPGLPDAPAAPGERYAWGGAFFRNGPRVHEYLREMNERVLSKYDVMTVGETGGVTTQDALLYAGEDRRELNMVFQFEHMEVDAHSGDKWHLRPWTLVELKRILDRWQADLQGRAWNSLYWSNHDQPRALSRFGNDGQYRRESATMLATALFLMQGTPFIYQGEEIGMTNVAFDSIEDYRDVEIQNLWRERVIQGHQDPREVLRLIQLKGRDNSRTPMQWDDTEHAGFTKETPWIKVNANYRWINVQSALSDPNSILHYYRRLIRLRKQYPALIYGSYRPVLAEHSEILAYTRTLGDEMWLIVTNFFAGHPTFDWPIPPTRQTSELILSNYSTSQQETLAATSSLHFTLRPYECRVYRLRHQGY